MAVTGRPTLFTGAIAAEICERLAEGQSLREICRDEHMPQPPTVRKWVAEDREGLAAPFARAREMQGHYHADEMLEIADDGTNDWIERQRKDGTTETVFNREHVERSKLRIDTRKWLLAKMLPKVYGDKTMLEHSGGMTLEQLVLESYKPPVEGNAEGSPAERLAALKDVGG